MSEVNLIIAAPWDYTPTGGAVLSLRETLERTGLVAGASVATDWTGGNGRKLTTWTWCAGPEVSAELGAEGCGSVTLSVAERLQPLIWPDVYKCPNGHRLLPKAIGRLADEMYRTGSPTVHVCHICGTVTNVLDLGGGMIRFLGSRLWLRFDNTGEPDRTTGPAMEAVKGVLQVDRLEFGVFNIPW